jgi:hypothetical protein
VSHGRFMSRCPRGARPAAGGARGANVGCRTRHAPPAYDPRSHDRRHDVEAGRVELSERPGCRQCCAAATVLREFQSATKPGKDRVHLDRRSKALLDVTTPSSVSASARGQWRAAAPLRGTLTSFSTGARSPTLPSGPRWPRSPAYE